MITTIYILIFGALGALCRYGLTQWPAFIYLSGSLGPTFFINVLGSGLIGCIYTLPQISSEPLRSGLMIGLLGGFTTFSSYALELFKLLSESRYAASVFYGFGTPLLSLGALILGIKIAKLF